METSMITGRVIVSNPLGWDGDEILTRELVESDKGF